MKIPQIEKIVNDLLRRKNAEFRREYNAPFNVAGAILYGSRVRGNNRPDSDLDVYSLTRDGTRLDVDTFMTLLEARLKIKVDDFDCGSYTSQDLGKVVFDRKNVMKGNYLVVTPFQDVRRTVEETIKKYKALKQKG